MPTTDAGTGRPVAKYVAVALGVAVGATGLVATFLPRSRADVSYRIVAVDLSRSDQATVTFELDKPPLATAQCAVSAFHDGSTEERQTWRLTGVIVGPSRDGRRTTRHTVVVPTTAQAHRAGIAECAVIRDH